MLEAKRARLSIELLESAAICMFNLRISDRAGKYSIYLRYQCWFNTLSNVAKRLSRWEKG
jgi:hypothetical protein